MAEEKRFRVCEKGHQYYKSSDCPTCPICEKENKPKDGFLSKLHSPVRRALTSEGIDTLEKLSRHTERDILKLHGIGPASIPVLKELLGDERLSFKE